MAHLERINICFENKSRHQLAQGKAKGYRKRYVIIVVLLGSATQNHLIIMMQTEMETTSGPVTY